MSRLSPVDVDVLEAGAHPAHGHVAQLLVLEPADRPLDLATLRAWYAGRLDRSTAFRQRLVQVPFRLHRPLWADDPDFDLDHHVRSIWIEHGDQAGVEAAVGRLLGLSLDLTRPPWEAWLIEGLDRGRVAVLTKQHLAAVDDRAGDEIAVAAVDVDPDGPTGDLASWAPGAVPGEAAPASEAETVLRAIASRARRPTVLAETVRGALRARRQRAPRRVPRVFRRSLTTRRQVASTTFSLGSVKAVKDHHDVTVNDVVLAVCAGGLRAWLEDREELPADPLLALVPVSVSGDLDEPEAGNQVSSMVSSLATDTRDPALRIQVIQDATREARRRRAIGARRLREWAEFAAPAVLGQAGRVSLRTIAETDPAPCNLIVANIPGPTVPLFVAGAAVTDLFFYGPLHEDVPLDITVVSYGDRMNVGLVGCPDADPDVGELVGHMETALLELVDTAPAADRPTAPVIAPPALRVAPVASEIEPGRDHAPRPGIDVGESTVLDDTKAALARSRRTREAAEQVTRILEMPGGDDPGASNQP